MNHEPITTNNVLQMVILMLIALIIYIIYHYQQQREQYKIAYSAHKKNDHQKFKEMKSELFLSLDDYRQATDQQILDELTNVVANDIKRTNNIKVELDYTYIQSGKIRLVLKHNIHVH